MSNNYEITRLNPDEMPVLIKWMQLEGWNPGIYDAQTFFAADNHGFFAGKLNGEIIAVASAVIYDDNFAFCGCYIVQPGFRQQGFGIALTKARLDYVKNRVTGLDGVLEMVHEYEKIGYRPYHKNIRFGLDHPIENMHSKYVTPITPDLFQSIVQYDQKYFPACRTEFLTQWIFQPEAKALIFLKDSSVLGYGVIRKCFAGYKVGPLFAESHEIARELFSSLCADINEFPVYLDIPYLNENALKLVNSYQMQPHFETIRMYRQGCPKMNLNHVYGITTFELG